MKAIPPSVLLADFSQVERALILAVIFASAKDQPENPKYVAIAKNLGGVQENKERMIRRARTRLLAGHVLTDHRSTLGFNPDYRAWIDPESGEPLVNVSLMHAIEAYEAALEPDSTVRLDASMKPDRNGLHPDTAVRLDDGDQPDKTRLHPDQGVRDRTVESGSPGPPTGKAPAGANSSVRDSLSGEKTNERTEGGCRGEPDDVVEAWTPGMLNAVPGWIGRLFDGSVPSPDLEALGRDFKAEARALDRSCFRVAAKYVAYLMATSPEKVRTVFGLTVSLARQWEKDEAIPGYATAAVEKFEASRRAKAGQRTAKTPICHVHWGPGHPDYIDTTPAQKPRLAPETMSA